MSQFVEIDTKDFQGFVDRLQKMGKQGEESILKALKESAIEGSGVMAKSAPRVTGRLASSIHPEFPNTTAYTYKDSNGRLFDGGFGRKPKGIEVAMGSNVIYAEIVNKKSSSPHFFEKGYKHANDMLERRLRFYLNKLMNNEQ
jgi:hypothetical protein